MTEMGYDLHITRSLDWTENSGHEIEAAEWTELADRDSELWRDPGNGPYAVRFRSQAWFDWSEGNVYTSDPDRATVSKMLAMAHALGGIVQGDDGETYDNAMQWPRRSEVQRR